LCCFPDEQGHPFTCMRRAPATAGGRARQYAMCRRANDDGSCMHVDGWECPRTPPPSPPPPDGTPLALVAGGSSHAILMPDGCHGNWQSCWENVGTMNARRGCCSASRGVAYGEIEPAGREFGCFRRVGRQFAMCKPLPRDVACASDDHWECPEAPPPSPVAAASDGGLTPPGLTNAADVACAGNYEACVLGIRPVLDRSCCLAGHDGKPFGCFKRVGRQFAMCRPLQLPCTSDETWECPMMPPSPPPEEAEETGLVARMESTAHGGTGAPGSVGGGGSSEQEEGVAKETHGALLAGAAVLVLVLSLLLRIVQRVEKLKQQAERMPGQAEEEDAEDDEDCEDADRRGSRKTKRRDGRMRIPAQ